MYSPIVDSIKVIRSGKVRRAKLYYLKDRKGKSARIAEKIKKKIGIDVVAKQDEISKSSEPQAQDAETKSKDDLSKKESLTKKAKKKIIYFSDAKNIIRQDLGKPFSSSTK